MEIDASNQLELFRQLFETSLDAILLTRPDGSCWRANRAAEDMLGYTSAEFAQLRRADFVDESDPATAALLRARAAQGHVRGMLKLRRKDGSWFDAQVASFLLGTPGGDRFAAIALRDMTEQLRLQRELDGLNASYLDIVEALFEGVIMYDAGGRISACNDSAERLLGLTRDQLMGRAPLDPRWRCIHRDGSTYPAVNYPSQIALTTGQPVRDVELGISRPDGSLVWLRVNANPMFRNGEAEPYGVVAAFEDMTQKTRLEMELRKESHTDVLTGVRNRRAFVEQAQQQFALSRRSGMPVSALVLDIDQFKEINDGYGLSVGDDVLKAVAEIVQGELRSSDCLARLGGAEFCVLLPNTAERSAGDMARRLQQAILDAEVFSGREAIALCASVGVATLAPSDADFRAWLQRAEQALHAARAARAARETRGTVS